jgi:hypothetical protein
LRISNNPGIQGNGFTFGIAPKVTKSLGPKPPKAEKPDGIPKIRKLATLKQYGFLNGIPPGFSPAERFLRQRPRGYRGCGITVSLLKPGIDLGSPCFIRTFSLSKLINSDTLTKTSCG